MGPDVPLIYLICKLLASYSFLSMWKNKLFFSCKLVLVAELSPAVKIEFIIVRIRLRCPWATGQIGHVSALTGYDFKL